LSASPIGTYRDAPALGADTDTILADWLGLKPGEIGSLRASNVI
jgi:crotonobetainyl-CoA:carnitine CoA-transferase CaiB-like acyl-CoA transferase